jgi:hypothetical protein
MATQHEDLDAEEADEQADKFVIAPVVRSESSFVLKTGGSDPACQPQLPIFLRRANTVSAAEFRKRQSRLKQIFGHRRKRSPHHQVAMSESGSQLALFHHLRGNSLIKQVGLNRLKFM